MISSPAQPCTRAALLLVIWAAAAAGQSTQGLITGRVQDSESDQPIAGGRVTWIHLDTGVSGSTGTGEDGIYTLPALSPGTYTLTAAAGNYQSKEVNELTLAVAGRLELDFRLRPLHDVWEQGSSRSVFLPGSRIVLNFFGPDFDTRAGWFEGQRGVSGALEATISEVIDPSMVRDLPFAGRDIYAALALMPGATSDSGTSRGLGLVVNGQRPSSSNFYLDGFEANSYLTGGPLTSLVPEAVQEYRFSTNNYSAQYGGTTGFIANAVTRTGGSGYHGSLYSFLQNRYLNANDFQRNVAGLGRPSGRVAELGYQVGGPIWKKRSLFFSSSLDRFGSRTEQSPINYSLPTGSFVATLSPDSIAYQLLSQHPSPAAKISGPMVASFSLSAPVTIERTIGLERVDYTSEDGRHRLSARVALARTSQPDFVWSPYQGLDSSYHQNTTSVGISHWFNINQSLVNEAKAGFSLDGLRWNRDSDVPNLVGGNAYLPGSPALYDYKNATKSWQFLDNLNWTIGRHMLTGGGAFLSRSLNGYMTPGESGTFYFASLGNFARDSPLAYQASTSYTGGGAASYYRTYRVGEFSLFLQDTFRVTPRLVLNLGLRFENFGSPVNTGAYKDPLIQLGSGSSLLDRLQTARVVAPQNSNESLYASSANWEPRLGVSYDLSGRGETILRAAFGIFQDRLFDNLWETTRLNDLASTLWTSFPPGPRSYLGPPGSFLPQFNRGLTTAPEFTLFEPNLPAGRSYNYFVGVQHRFSSSLTAEVNTLGAAGRNLLTTDLVNRSPSAQASLVVNPTLPFNIRYRGPQGISDYNALTASLRFQTSYAQLRVNYTWSHSIDNQSDSLEGDQFDLTGVQNPTPLGFSRQFDPNSDRGNSDFDQRHNLVFYSVWELPSSRRTSWSDRLLRNWRFSQLAAFRTGFPYSIYGQSGARVDILNPTGQSLSPAQVVPGGILVLNRADFVNATPGSGQNSGRNAFRGPGLYNIDISLSRTFPLRRLSESARLVLRADSFNFLNHVNLGNPGNFFLNPATFGISSYERKGFDNGFPATSPLQETPRQIQLSLRFEF